MREFNNLINNAGYAIKDFTELFGQNEYCFSIWEKRKSGFRLSLMNPSFGRLFGIRDTKENRYITDCYQVDCLKKIENTHKILTFVYLIDKDNMWNVHVEYKNERIYVFSYKLKSMDKFIRYCCFLTDTEMLEYDFSYEIELLPDQNSYSIVEYGCRFKKLFQIEKDGPIQIKSGPPSDTFRKNYIKALSYEQNIRFAHILEINDIRVPILQEFILNAGNDPNRMIIMANMINYEQYEIISNLYDNRFSYIYNCYMNGFGYVAIQEGKTVLQSVNSVLNYFFQYDMNSKEKIIHSKAIKLTLQHGHHHKQEMELIGQNNCAKKCELHVVPAVSAEKIEYLIIYLRLEEEKEKEFNMLRVNNLTKRECEVLYYAATGDTNNCIASKLGITTGTVKRIIYNGYKKLNICSRIELEEFRECLKFSYCGYENIQQILNPDIE